MRGTATIALVLMSLVLLSGPAAGREWEDAANRRIRFNFASRETLSTTVWTDDTESGENGWTHGDFSSSATPHFHVDTYMAYSGSSWWCGTFDFDADGGYGNNWDDRLDVPSTDWTGYTYPVLTYYYRCDSEFNYDFTYAQAESNGTWVDLNRGYTGTTAWTSDGYYLGNKDNPAVCRFRFVSDAAYSDADGYYLSVGGGFACDDIQIYDFNTTDVLFFDDVEGGGLCTPSVPAAAGDYWHISDASACQVYSPTHYWAVASPDTDFVQPNLQNWLQTPVVNISSYRSVVSCTLWVVFQGWIAGSSGGGWVEEVTTDGGATWNEIGSWYFDQCGYGYGPCDHFLFGLGATPYLPGTGQVAFRWTVLSGDDGISADPVCPYSSAGITIDDVWIDIEYDTPVEETSWGRIKSLYR